METLAKLLPKFSTIEILDRLLELYPGERRNLVGYSGAIAELKEIKPTVPLEGITISVTEITTDDIVTRYDLDKPWKLRVKRAGWKWERFPRRISYLLPLSLYRILDKPYADVSGISNKEMEDNPAGTAWAIAFSPWEEILATGISETPYNELDTLCHILWEITWAGYSNQEIKSELDELKERSDEIDRWEKEGTLDEHTVSWDEVKEKVKGSLKNKDSNDNRTGGEQ